MTAPHFQPNTADLDDLLTGVGEALELTPTQRAHAVREYQNLGAWLSRPNTLIGSLQPDVYAQGSKRIGTEVRPIRSADGDACEHDLDAVAELRQSRLAAMEQYEALYKCLFENPAYRPHLVRKNRCIRIDFPGEFHLDVLPARPDLSRPGTSCIEVPDRKLECWKTSNPKGFALWFEAKGALAREQFSALRKAEALRKAIAPLPQVPTYAEKPVLNLIVQLIKRRRDVVFQGGSSAPRSIVLTTLAAEMYDGEVELFPALVHVVGRIHAAIEVARPARIQVHNPMDPKENFAEAWSADEVSYQRFVDFIAALNQELRALGQATGIERVVGILKALFGETPVEKSYSSLREQLRKAGDAGTLRVEKGRGLSGGAVGAGIIIPRSTHFGAE